MTRLTRNLFAAITRRERRALAVLLTLALAGHLIRALAAGRPDVPPPVQLLDQAGDGDPLAHRDSIRRQGAPLGADERIDIDHASVEQLERLPGIGPATAKRIVADRQNSGAFGNLDGLRRVKGMGPATIARLAPHLSFGGSPAEAHLTTLPNMIDVNLASVADLVGLPGIGATRARAIVAFRDSAGPFRQISDLRHVRGITAATIRLLGDRLGVP
ncbi:MAG TPA: helix-hairpin-helix domain-containing protein [Gemmatimonadales bacterium]|jgi:competence ComEA-like helix-hairpin-helix protein